MSSATMLITEFVHNTDLNPSEAYIATVPRLRTVLHYQPLTDSFNVYDQIANRKQKIVRRTGMTALLLGTISLIGIALELLLSGFQLFVPWQVTVSFESFALASICLTLSPWIGKTRTQWLTARFMTEQMRQWHFQLFLDGRLVSQAEAALTLFETERKRRWDAFIEQASNAEGLMHNFVDGDSVSLHHKVSAYGDSATAEQASRAYLDLRLDKQLAFFKLKREYFSVRDDWSEALARWTIFSALLVTSSQLIIAAVRRLSSSEVWRPASESMFAAAMLLVVISAAVRVYRTALAVSAQRERYETKWVRLIALRATFDTAQTSDEKLRIMREVELVEVEELREFLRQMRRTSYLF